MIMNTSNTSVDTLVIGNTHLTTFQPNIETVMQQMTQKFFRKENNEYGVTTFHSVRILSYKGKTFQITINIDDWDVDLLTENNGWIKLFNKYDLMMKPSSMNNLKINNEENRDEFANKITEEFIKLIISIY